MLPSLSEQTLSALEASQFLIVICSPSTLKNIYTRRIATGAVSAFAPRRAWTDLLRKWSLSARLSQGRLPR